MMMTGVKDHSHPFARTLLPICCPVIPGKSADLLDMPACQPLFGLFSSSIDCGPLRYAMWVTALCALTATRRGAGPCMNASNVGNPCVCTLAWYHAVIDFKVSCTGKDMHSGPDSSSYDDPDPSLPSSFRPISPSSESSASPPLSISRRSAGGSKK